MDDEYIKAIVRALGGETTPLGFTPPPRTSRAAPSPFAFLTEIPTSPPPSPFSYLAAIPTPPESSPFSFLGAIPTPPPPNPFSFLAATPFAPLGVPPPSALGERPLGEVNSLLRDSALPPVRNALLTEAIPVKRRAFFSFHYDDSFRVNAVRTAFKKSFYDSSLWEKRKVKEPETIKRIIRAGVQRTSAVCVLIGSDTWCRRWVKYEIARAIVDRRGLLGVHLNNIRHHKTSTPHPQGPNPFFYMAVGKVQSNALATPTYYLFERVRSDGEWAWLPYEDYTKPVSLPRWLSDPMPGYVTRLSQGVEIYDYIAHQGHKNIGGWIDRAAQLARR